MQLGMRRFRVHERWTHRRSTSLFISINGSHVHLVESTEGFTCVTVADTSLRACSVHFIFVEHVL